MNRRNLVLGAATAGLVAGSACLAFAGQGSGREYANAIARMRTPLPTGTDRLHLVRMASLAANGHNTQPWRFTIDAGAISIKPDLSRRTPVVDPDDHHLYASLGCAAEDLAIAAAHNGLPGDLVFKPEGAGVIVFEHAVATPRPSALCAAIARRQSARVEYDGSRVSADDVSVLSRATKTNGVDTVLITERREISRIRDLVIAANSVQMADAAFMRELKSWMRFNPGSALIHGDGLYSAASSNPTLPNWLGGPMFDLAFQAKSENEKYARHMDSSSGVAIFIGAREDHAHWITVGRACQRFALQATALGMKVAFVNQPVEVAAFRPQLAALLGASGRRPDIVMRFGYGPDLPMSPRRDVTSIIDI